ncbi:alpha/beta fold hydrolase [uncultured Rothia sp.]|uniref:alpha/beta fold hydrolase n=1 Tax=uncultured Rothia sp. TaxID=316088 RepID=UPI003217E508
MVLALSPQLPVPSHKVGATVAVGDFALTNHYFSVPAAHGLVHSLGREAAENHPLAQQTLTVFAREVVNTSSELTLSPEDRPFMVYLQGGPGGKSPRPTIDSGWVHELSKTHRIVLLDQRGTGLSTPLSAPSILAQGSVREQEQYLELFRADSIIADAEVIRSYLLAERKDQRWSTMGQSFGGFLTLSYLSFAPESLRDSRMTAGLAPIRAHIDDVYRHTLERVKERNEEFYGWYPQDRVLAARIAEFIREKKPTLPTGETLTDHRFQMLGAYLGGNARVRELHYILETAFAESNNYLSAQFLSSVSEIVSFASAPLYGLLHESIYADGPALGASPSPAPTNWSAARMANARDDFSPEAETLLFTGEHIFPWYFEEDPALAPLHDVAHALAEKDDWGKLYDHEQLAQNTVPLVAAVYRPDIYVDYEHSMKTAQAVANTRVWSSDTHHHDGLSADGTAILTHLKNLLADNR